LDIANTQTAANKTAIIDRATTWLLISLSLEPQRSVTEMGSPITLIRARQLKCRRYRYPGKRGNVPSPTAIIDRATTALYPRAQLPLPAANITKAAPQLQKRLRMLSEQTIFRGQTEEETANIKNERSVLEQIEP
jgi:hypothetical protein